MNFNINDRYTILSATFDMKCNRYSSKVMLLFVIPKNARSARKESLCEMKFTDTHSNAHVRLVHRLSAISDFFRDSNIVGKNNQAR